MTSLDGNGTRCRVCGFDLGESPWGPDNSSPTYIICWCCGAEAGVDEITREAALFYRKNWIISGAQWFSPKYRPAGWDLQRQLTHVPGCYR